MTLHKDDSAAVLNIALEKESSNRTGLNFVERTERVAVLVV